MLLTRACFGIGIAACIIFLHSKAYAQSANDQPTPQSISVPQPINPITGPSFPCPQPSDPLAQLVCSTPQLALLDMQFVQSYEALYQQVGVENEPALRHEDFEFDLAVRSACNIAVSQGATQSPTPPPAAPVGAAQCVIPLYQQQIAVWKARLQGAAAEEANRPIQDQLALQSHLQALGFLPARAQIDGVFGTGTRAAIIQWQTSVGRQPTGLLGNADARALLADEPQTAPNSSPNPSAPLQSQTPPAVTAAQPNSSVETAWLPYTQYAGCMLSKGFQLQTFVQDGVLPNDALAASVLNSCIQAGQQAKSAPTSLPAVVPNNSNSDASNADPSESSNEPLSTSSTSESSNTASGTPADDSGTNSPNTDSSDTNSSPAAQTNQQLQTSSNSTSSPQDDSSPTQNSASEPPSAQIVISSGGQLIADILDPTFQRNLSLNNPQGQTLLAHSVLIDAHDDSEYTSGGNGFIVGYAMEGSYYISCQLSLDDTKRYMDDTDITKGGTFALTADIWGTVKSYSQNSGFFIDPCEYKIVSEN